MKWDWIDGFCLELPGAEREEKPAWDATCYVLRGKIFAMRGNDGKGRPIVTVKLEPAFGQEMRGTYRDIVPGYYMNKEHWNSVYLEGETPEDLLRDLLRRSHGIVLRGLKKKDRLEILADGEG